MKRIIRFFGAVAVCILILGFAELAAPAGFRALSGNTGTIDWRVGIPSVQSLFIHPGQFGWFCGFIALFAFAFYIHQRKISSLLLFLLFTLGALISMRLKVMGALATAAAIGLWLYSSRFKVGIVAVTGVLALLILVVFRAQIGGVVREQIEEYRDPLKPRNVLYKTGLIVAGKNFPLGVGFGRYGGEIAARYYSPIYREYHFSRIHGLDPEGRFLRDTFWPMVLGELGAAGLVVYLAVLIYLFRLLIRAYRAAPNILSRSFALGACLVFIEGMIESLAEPVFTKPPAAYFIFAAAGITCSLYCRFSPLPVSASDGAKR